MDCFVLIFIHPLQVPSSWAIPRSVHSIVYYSQSTIVPSIVNISSRLFDQKASRTKENRLCIGYTANGDDFCVRVFCGLAKNSGIVYGMVIYSPVTLVKC